ncbi:MAG TPA: diadenylate cyclase CdaA [Bacillales bacterium]|nr:diadenylate cyclase CdaA [Bacillales bacterium]
MPSFDNFQLVDYLVAIVDILVVTYIVYRLIMVIRGTKAVQLLKGIIVIIIVWFLSKYLHLYTLHWMMQKAINYGFFAIIIIFQPELRRALEQLGRGGFFGRGGTPEKEDLERSVEAIVKAVGYMAKRRIGALISIERQTGLSDYVETGITLNSQLTYQLLVNIFIPNTPLHDGAVIIKENEILAAACYLPLSESPFISKELGTRHRAALGISEVTDSLTLVVSEETGQISITKNGELHRDIEEDTLQSMLTQELLVNSRSNSSSLWNWRGKNHG